MELIEKKKRKDMEEGIYRASTFIAQVEGCKPLRKIQETTGRSRNPLLPFSATDKHQLRRVMVWFGANALVVLKKANKNITQQ